MSEKRHRMNNAAKFGPRCGTSQERQQIRAIAYDVAVGFGRAGDEKFMREVITKQVQYRMKHKYGFIGWQWLVWFVLPRMLDWFFKWYWEDQRLEMLTDDSLQHAIDRARGEGLG